MSVTVTRRGAGKPVKRFATELRAGGRTHRLSLPARGLRRGDYVVRLEATAGGRTVRSSPVSKRL